MSELRLNTDGHIIKLGADNDVTLTHVADTGILLNSTMKLQFNDASQFIQGSSATVLSIGATDEIDLTATAVDLNGTLNVSGVATFQAAPVFPDGSLAVADLDIDGATDIGAAIVDADLFIIDDGAGGTNRKVTASRLKTYAAFDADAAQVFNESGADVDFRVETSSQAGAFFIDGGTDVICFGTVTNQTLAGKAAKIQIDGGTSAAQSTAAVISRVAGTAGGALALGHTRHATPGSFTILNDNDELGKIEFFADDGVDTATLGASIVAQVNGTPGGNDMPTELIFSTTADGASSTTDRLTLDAAGSANFTGNVTIKDDKILGFGNGADWAMATPNGDPNTLVLNRSGTLTSNTNSAGWFNFISHVGGGTMYDTRLEIYGAENEGSRVNFHADQSDDNADHWYYGMSANGEEPSADLLWVDYDSGSYDTEMKLTQAGVLSAEGAMNASTTVDYAEYFEWKTALANDTKITDTYGMTVVLDGDKIRLAETGEEAKVLGVVRPNDVSAVVGGAQDLKWKNKWKKDVWGQLIREEYTQVSWFEINEDGTKGKKHSYMKDRIPSHVLNEELQDRHREDRHTLDKNFTKDKDGLKIELFVPTTDADKSKHSYVEKTEYTTDKAPHKKGDKLMRKVFNDSYDSTLSKDYKPRSQRRKEWCVVGLLGQVEIRDTAIIPTSWTKMKNLETGIDLYYIK